MTKELAYTTELHALIPTLAPINAISLSATSVSTDENALVQHLIEYFADWLSQPHNKISIDNAREKFENLHKWNHGRKSVLRRLNADEFKLESLVQFF